MAMMQLQLFGECSVLCVLANGGAYNYFDAQSLKCFTIHFILIL